MGYNMKKEADAMDINEKFASLTAEQSKALAEAMNAAYNKKAEPAPDENKEDHGEKALQAEADN